LTSIQHIRYKRTYNLDQVWMMILTIKDRLEKGNMNEDYKYFLTRELEVLEKIHQAAAELEEHID